MPRYTKADLEQIVAHQLENLNAMHDLLTIMKQQNELLHKTNDKLHEQLHPPKKSKPYPRPSRKRK